jgi:hypothetical protein
LDEPPAYALTALYCDLPNIANDKAMHVCFVAPGGNLRSQMRTTEYRIIAQRFSEDADASYTAMELSSEHYNTDPIQ